ncbi:MAG TPA: hypothetical protein VHB02_02615 [Acidimicrobiales bacterium]|nr:hypothetical protein [Acidimicrobiales bacterium]
MTGGAADGIVRPAPLVAGRPGGVVAPVAGADLAGPGRGSAGGRGGDGGRRSVGGRLAATDRGGAGSPPPARLRPSVCYTKDEVIEVCGALALAEVVLARLGCRVEADRMAAVFDLVEGRLAG